MHFLSHYYTECLTFRPYPNRVVSPLYVAALGIPDLVPGFSKIYNSKIVKISEPENADLKEIHRGILRHYAGDKWFHNSPVFVGRVSLICEEFIKVGLNRERLRLSVLAHVATEMMIDRQIVLQENGVCEEYYERIMEANETALGGWFLWLGQEKEKNIFIAKFRSFKDRKFMFLFKEMERIVFGLERIYASVTGTEFTGEEKLKLLSALNNIDAEMRYSWKSLLKP